MSSILKDRLLANYEKALDKGRIVLIIVCRVFLKGVPVADKFIGLSKCEKKKLFFNQEQIKIVESGRTLENMDISILHVIQMAFGGLSSGRLHDLLKQFKDLRNDYVHEKIMLSLDKKELKVKLDELEVLYTEILEELKNHCDPAKLVLIDNAIADIKVQLLSLEKTLDDHLQDNAEALRRESDKAISTLQTFAKVSASLDQTTYKTTQAVSTLEQATSILGKATSTLEHATSTMEQVKSSLQQAAANSSVASIKNQNVNIIENLNILGSTVQLSEIEKETRILQHLFTVLEPVNSLEVAKALGLQTKNDVNPTLYKLSKENSIQKINASPPLWQAKREVKLCNDSSAANEIIVDNIESKFASMSLTNNYSKNVQEVSLLALEKQILDILLRSSVPVKPLILVKTIGETKREVNKILYIMQEKGLINKVEESPPSWQILENGRIAFQRSTEVT